MEPTEVLLARLVLGYLKEHCGSAYKAFLNHYHNNETEKLYVTRFQGSTLESILEEYVEIYHMVLEKLEATNYFSEKHENPSITNQLSYLFSRTPTPCSRSPSDCHIDETSSSYQDVQKTSSKEHNTGSPPGTELLAQTSLEDREIHEKIAQTNNKVAEKQPQASTGIYIIIRFVVLEDKETVASKPHPIPILPKNENCLKGASSNISKGSSPTIIVSIHPSSTSACGKFVNDSPQKITEMQNTQDTDIINKAPLPLKNVQKVTTKSIYREQNLDFSTGPNCTKERGPSNSPGKKQAAKFLSKKKMQHKNNEPLRTWDSDLRAFFTHTDPKNRDTSKGATKRSVAKATKRKAKDNKKSDKYSIEQDEAASKKVTLEVRKEKAKDNQSIIILSPSTPNTPESAKENMTPIIANRIITTIDLVTPVSNRSIEPSDNGQLEAQIIEMETKSARKRVEIKSVRTNERLNFNRSMVGKVRKKTGTVSPMKTYNFRVRKNIWQVQKDPLAKKDLAKIKKKIRINKNKPKADKKEVKIPIKNSEGREQADPVQLTIKSKKDKFLVRDDKDRSTHKTTKSSRVHLQEIVNFLDNFPDYPDLYEPLKLQPFYPDDHYKQSLHCQSWGDSSNCLVQKVGLYNLGNTCYMNSVLQALFMTKTFRIEVLLYKKNMPPLLSKLQLLFALLQYSKKSALSPADILYSSKPPGFLPGHQHDSSEFLGYLLDNLHEQEKNSNGSDDSVKKAGAAASSIISTCVQQSFGGRTVIIFKCGKCYMLSCRVDHFRELQLSFPNCSNDQSVQTLLDYYLKPEMLWDNNQYKCCVCGRFTDGVRLTKIVEAPAILILTLKRFKYDPKSHQPTKLLQVVKLDQHINLNQYQYELYAAVVHYGLSIDSGHYYTFARDKTEWYKFNDCSVMKITPEDLCCLKPPETPYILFYSRQDVGEPDALPCAVLSSRLQIALTKDRSEYEFDKRHKQNGDDDLPPPPGGMGFSAATESIPLDDDFMN